MTAEEKARRNALIVADRARGRSWRSLAETYELDERSIRRIWTEFRNEKRPVLVGEDPLDVVFDLIQRFEAWGEQLAEVAENASSDSNRIGAIRSQMECAMRQAELRQATGLLPKHLGQLRVEMDLRFITTKVLAIFEKYELPVEAHKELVESLSVRGSQN